MPLILKQLKKAFDPKLIRREIKRGNAKVQSRFGAYARTVMKNSLKYKPFGASAPAGKPPFVHTSNAFTRQKKNRTTGVVTRQASSPLRELIFFARDDAHGSVVVGPVLFGKAGAKALEHGGVTTTSAGKGKTKSVFVRAHPFAAPAGAAAAEKLPGMLAKSIN